MNRYAGLWILAAVGALVFLVFGLWAFFDPHSFYDGIAEFPPYNAHFLHDVGAFQIGIGATLLFALVWRTDALLVALLGSGTGTAFHVVSHIEDSDLGGTDFDTISLGALAVLLLAGGITKVVWRVREGSAGFR